MRKQDEVGSVVAGVGSFHRFGLGEIHECHTIRRFRASHDPHRILFTLYGRLMDASAGCVVDADFR